jgi:spermidine/putrescine transport system permease protein
MVRFGATPAVNAASTVLILVTIVLTLIAVRLQRPERTIGEEGPA